MIAIKALTAWLTDDNRCNKKWKMKHYKKLRSFGVLCKMWSVLGVIIVFFGILAFVSDGNPDLILFVALPLAIIGAVVHFFTFQAATELIILLIRLERNTRGISDLNDTLKQQTIQRPIQTAPNPQTPNKPTLNVPKQ